MNDITEFSGEYRWLSNFHPIKITLADTYPSGEMESLEYGSVECAYMSAKSNDPDWKKFCQQNKPGLVKKASYTDITLRPRWDAIKLDVMRTCLQQKFKDPELRAKLLATWPGTITEGNNHGDDFWGVRNDTGKGENMLGKMLMEERDRLRLPQICVKGF
jgi:ribA/ribD-fused uncharacterized protein